MRDDPVYAPAHRPSWARRPWPGCDICRRPLWPDTTAENSPPAWVCPACPRPQGRFWHRHTGERCPYGYLSPLATDTSGGLHICC
ncbi:hypothetical protein [Streptomyces avicenniae]|uniref:hypothetical protein n=1 Tax=Streptomyces avicenniae TaxID=500153 RepID=UPI000DA5FF7C|nr:hypothetical protein [Streptomyces avicenniae]